jgi:Mce-associated membrane protein
MHDDDAARQTVLGEPNLSNGDDAPFAVVDTNVGDDAIDDSLPEAPRPGGWHTRITLPVVVSATVFASTAAAATSYVVQFRPDQQIDDRARTAVIQTASNGTTAVLSYAAQTLDGDLSKAKSFLTGDFLNYYTQFTRDIVTPAVKQKSVKASAAVVQAAAVETHPSSAVVLVFVDQTTTSAQNPAGSVASSSVKVTLTKVSGAWLISSFDPV